MFDAAAVDHNVPAAVVHTLGVNRCNDTLTAEKLCRFVDELRIAHSCRIDANLVAAGAQRVAHVVDGADAAANGQRHEHHFGGATHNVEHGGAAFMAGGDVEKNDLISATVAVLLRQLHRIADFLDADEINPLDDFAVAHIQTWNDSFCEHRHASFARASASSRESVPS